MILLDTCALIWLVADQKHLSFQAKEAIRNNPRRLYVSAISAFEIAIKSSKGKIELPLPAQEWYSEAISFHGIEEINLDSKILIQSVNLQNFHNDPCDRIIISTAMILGLNIITKDKLFSKYKNIRIIW